MYCPFMSYVYADRPQISESGTISVHWKNCDVISLIFKQAFSFPIMHLFLSPAWNSLGCNKPR